MGEVRYRTAASSRPSMAGQDPLSGDQGLRDSSKTRCRPAGCPLDVWALGINECGGVGGEAMQMQSPIQPGLWLSSDVPVSPDRRRWMSLGCCSPALSRAPLHRSTCLRTDYCQAPHTSVALGRVLPTPPSSRPRT